MLTEAKVGLEGCDIDDTYCVVRREKVFSMLDLKEVSQKIDQGSDGIWRTRGSEEVSYTEGGHGHLKKVEEESFWFDHRLNCLNSAIEHRPFRSKVLDVGGGNGNFSLLLQSQNIEAVLLEPVAEGVQNARLSGVENIVHGTLNGVDFKESSFASVVALDVLEHIEDDREFVREIHRILEPSGRLYLSVPALQLLFSSFDRQVGHFRRYTLGQLVRLLWDNGFKVEFATYFFY